MATIYMQIKWDGMLGVDRLKLIREAAAKQDAVTVYDGLSSMSYGFDNDGEVDEARSAGVSDLETLWRAGRDISKSRLTSRRLAA